MRKKNQFVRKIKLILNNQFNLDKSWFCKTVTSQCYHCNKKLQGSNLFVLKLVKASPTPEMRTVRLMTKVALDEVKMLLKMSLLMSSVDIWKLDCCVEGDKLISYLGTWILWGNTIICELGELAHHSPTCF